AKNLVGLLNGTYGLSFRRADSPPAAGGGTVTSVLWNTQTVEGGPRGWPEPIGRWFRAGSSKFARLGLAAEGAIFDRLAPLYPFSAPNQPPGRSFAVLPLP